MSKSRIILVAIAAATPLVCWALSKIELDLAIAVGAAVVVGLFVYAMTDPWP